MISTGRQGVRINEKGCSLCPFMARVPGHNLGLDELRCFGCAACIAACPIDVLILEPPIIAIREESCTHCEICIPTCPVHALSIMEA